MSSNSGFPSNTSWSSFSSLLPCIQITLSFGNGERSDFLITFKPVFAHSIPWRFWNCLVKPFRKKWTVSDSFGSYSKTNHRIVVKIQLMSFSHLWNYFIVRYYFETIEIIAINVTERMIISNMENSLNVETLNLCAGVK